MGDKITKTDRKVLQCIRGNGTCQSELVGDQLWNKPHIRPQFRTGNATRALQRLQQKRLVQSSRRHGERDAFYSLTSKGLKTLSEEP